jgi:Ca-activated chloride channel homolog
MIRLASWYFLLLIPLFIYIFLLRKEKSALKFSSVKLLMSSGMKKTVKHKIGRVVIVTGLAVLAVALARPQLTQNAGPVRQNGIDIAALLDVSGSMQSVDFQPNRLEAAKKTTEDFIAERPEDKISLVIFAGTAYTRIPLTLDHNIVNESIDEITAESVNEDGTAIGTAISVGLNRLKNSEAASKIMILVTDGDNNAGTIAPDTACEMAKEMGIKIYTIGVGTDKTIIPVQGLGQTSYQQVEGGLNEDLLKKIADTTGGRYYRARDSKALSQIYSTINKLEKTEFKHDSFTEYTELAYSLIGIALVLLLVGIFLDRYYFIRIP